MCARSFPTKAYLKIHMRTHNDKHIKCTLCTKMFRWESALKSHLAAAHAQTAGLFNCEFCGKQFKDKSNLKSHRYTHLDVKPHSCSKCGRGFIRRDMMLTHEKNCRLWINIYILCICLLILKTVIKFFGNYNAKYNYFENEEMGRLNYTNLLGYCFIIIGCMEWTRWYGFLLLKYHVCLFSFSYRKHVF